ncbi:MAG: hypothetical protein QXQ29_06120 [Candidatus Bathyarchaeia archaeon]
MGVEEAVSRLKSFSEELGLDLTKPEDRFKWFLASMLFAKRISAEIAKRAYRRFEEAGLTTPDGILEAGWDRIVQVLDSGGYVRYDFSTASNIIEAVKKLRDEYGGLEELHRISSSSEDLERRLKEFKGIGSVAVSIFLRELRGVWLKAKPSPSKIAIDTARRIGLHDIERYESQLIRLNLEYCKKHRCCICPAQSYCGERLL